MMHLYNAVENKKNNLESVLILVVMDDALVLRKRFRPKDKNYRKS